jgi:hypothetical protein
LILAYWLYVYRYSQKKKKKWLEVVEQALAPKTKNSCNFASKQAKQIKAKQTSTREAAVAVAGGFMVVFFFLRFCVVEETLCEARQAPVLCASSIAVLSNLNSCRFGAQTQLST